MSEIKPEAVTETEIENYKGFEINLKDKGYHNMVTVIIPVRYHFNTKKQAEQFIDNKILKRK